MEGSRLRARYDGVREEIVRLGRARHEAEAALEAAVAPSSTEPTQSSAGACRYSRPVNTGYSRSRDQTRGSARVRSLTTLDLAEIR